MKSLYIECAMGAAGDMLTAALLELHPDPVGFVERLNACGIPGVSVFAEESVKCGIKGTHISVLLDGAEEHEHHHEHEHHNHHHHHEHMDVSGIGHIISHLHVSDEVKQDIYNVFNIIAEAESKVHGKPVEQVHFHEVGTMDAVADITAVCMLIAELKPMKIMASSINVGGGTVKCAHGILPVPAPATAEILKGIPSYSGKVKSELCTPTGAALLKYFVNEFCDMPVMSTDKIGYGMGRKDFELPNCVRIFMGDINESKNDSVCLLSCNIDDMTGEELGFAVTKLLEFGVLDVWTTPIFMKKNRPAYMLSCLCKPEKADETASAVFKYTTTIGVRMSRCDRYCLDREMLSCETDIGSVRIKRSCGFGVSREKIEYDDLVKIAESNNISLREAREML